MARILEQITVGHWMCFGRFGWVIYLLFASLFTITFFITKALSTIVDSADGNELREAFYLSIMLCPWVCFAFYYISKNGEYLGTCYPRYVKGCRKRMTPHNLALHSILSLSYRHIPQAENLRTIAEHALKRVVPIVSIIVKTLNTSDLEIFLAGSTAERFNAPLSQKWMKSKGGIGYFSHAIITDFDYMIYPKMEKGSFDNREYYQVIENDANLQPGCVYILQDRGRTYLKAEDVRRGLLKSIKKLKIADLGRQNYLSLLRFYSVKMNGPAVELSVGQNSHCHESRVNDFFADVVFSIKCIDWPGSASNWLQRSNRNWPQCSEVVRIAEMGCHLVPKSQPEDKQGLTWRISFSNAEVELSKLVPQMARMCYVGLKIITKDYLSIACNRLTSYHLKNVLFFTLEKSDAEFWLHQENIGKGFHLLLDNLLNAVEIKFCPHFWLNHVNLFKEFTNKHLQKLLNCLHKIKVNPEGYIELSKYEYIISPKPHNIKNYGTCSDQTVDSRENDDIHSVIEVYE